MKVTKEAAEGGGIDYVAEVGADPDDTVRWRVRGDAFPRVEIDPRGTIKTGTGAVGPTLIGGVGGPIINARNSYNVLDAGLVRTTDPGYPGATPASIANSFAFALLVAQHTNESCDYLFPAGVYDTVGFHLTNPGQRLIGAGGAAADQGDPLRGTKFVHRHATNDCVRLIGINGNRSFGMGAIGIRVTNQAAAPRGLVLEHLSHFYLEDVWVSGFRGAGGGLRAANAVDGALYDCCTDFCGSADQTNLAAVLLTATDSLGAATEDACNQIRFIRHRFENISDRILEFKSVGGLIVNKIQFLASKLENSQVGGNSTNGSNDANQAYFLLDHADWISFVQCDFTVQLRQSAFVLPTMFRVKNGSRLDLCGSRFFGGSLGPTKVFTTYITAGDSSDFVSLADVFLNMSDAAGFPTRVLTGNNASKPILAQTNVGFDPYQGSGKVATDWYTAADWNETSGMVSGVSSLAPSFQANVKDYGAIGDGVVDDTVAIEAAAASGALDIWFPKGVYLCKPTSATMKPRAGQTWHGMGAASVIQFADGTGADASTTTQYGIDLQGLAYVTFCDLVIDGGLDSVGAGGSTATAVTARTTDHFTMRNVELRNAVKTITDTGVANRSGIDLGDATYASVTDCFIHDIGWHPGDEWKNYSDSNGVAIRGSGSRFTKILRNWFTQITSYSYAVNVAGVLAFSAGARTSGSTVLTVLAGHGYVAGMQIAVDAPSDASYEGYFTVTAVTSTTITYAQPGIADDAASGAGIIGRYVNDHVVSNNIIHDVMYAGIEWFSNPASHPLQGQGHYRCVADGNHISRTNGIVRGARPGGRTLTVVSGNGTTAVTVTLSAAIVGHSNGEKVNVYDPVTGANRADTYPSSTNQRGTSSGIVGTTMIITFATNVTLTNGDQVIPTENSESSFGIYTKGGRGDPSDFIVSNNTIEFTNEPAIELNTHPATAIGNTIRDTGWVSWVTASDRPGIYAVSGCVVMNNLVINAWGKGITFEENSGAGFNPGLDKCICIGNTIIRANYGATFHVVDATDSGLRNPATAPRHYENSGNVPCIDFSSDTGDITNCVCTGNVFDSASQTRPAEYGIRFKVPTGKVADKSNVVHSNSPLGAFGNGSANYLVNAVATPFEATGTRSVTGTATVDLHDRLVRCISGGSYTVNLPLAAKAALDPVVIRNDQAIGVITVDGNGAQTIDGATTLLVQPGGSVSLVSDFLSAWTTVADSRNTVVGFVDTPKADVDYTVKVGEIARATGLTIGRAFTTPSAPSEGDEVAVLFDSGGAVRLTISPGTGTLEVANGSGNLIIWEPGEGWVLRWDLAATKWRMRRLTSFPKIRFRTIADPSGANYAPDCSFDQITIGATITGGPPAITFVEPVGTKTDGQQLVLRLTDAAPTSTLAWTTGVAGSYATTPSGPALPVSTVVGALYVTLRYNSAIDRWDCVGVV